jgi:DNA polymerase IV
MPRTIIHIDLDAFYCAVEENLDPSLQDLPFAVGGRPDQRGVVASCSYAARKFGVRSAMPMSRALNLCPNLIIVPHNFRDYHDASHLVMKILHNVTPLVEQISVDEAFLDISGLPQSGTEMAKDLQAKINDELNLPCSFGVATNKLIAKIANNIGKVEASSNTDGPPNAIKVIPPGKEAEFLAPLPIRELWGIGPKTAEKLHRMHIGIIGELAQVPERELIRRFGKLGAEMALRSKGIDGRSIQTEHDPKSISKEITFTQDTSDAEALHRVLRKLSDEVGWRLRHDGLRGSTVRIKFRLSDFTTMTRQTTLTHPINQDDELYNIALKLFEKHCPPGKMLRLIGVGISGFDTAARQLDLWETEDSKKNRQLQSALDQLKDRFGENAIRRGSTLRRNEDK